MSAKTLRGLMHQLRNPLVPILGYAELLEQQGGGPDVSDKAREIIRAANLLVTTTDNLLTLALLEQGQRPPVTQDCDVIVMVRASMGGMVDRASVKGVKLAVDSGQWRNLRADREHLAGALDIIFLIAIELTPRFGTVTTRMVAVGSGGSLWIEGCWSDRGAAIALDGALEDATSDVDQVAPLYAQLASQLMSGHGGRLTLTRDANVSLQAELEFGE
jgi:signal transduction histidine kinase